MSRMLAGFGGGAVGGAIVGLGEAAVIATGTDASDYWAFVFGTLWYAGFGAAIGAGWAFVAGIVARRWSSARVMALAGGLAAAGLGMVVARFRVIRDMFAEDLAIGSSTGIAVHIGLLAGGLVLLVIVTRLLSRSATRRGVPATVLRAVAAITVIAVGAAIGLGSVLGESRAQPAAAAATAAGPNAILIIADTLRADHTGPYGATEVATPALDRLAADGIVFERAFANSSWTRPSIATIVTSLYASSHAVMHKTDLLPDAVDTIAEVARRGGYRTAGFVTNINVAPSFNFDQGFDRYDYLAPEYFFNATDSATKLSLYSGMRLIRERFLSKKKWVEHYYQDAATVSGSSLPWLDENAKEPYFVLVHYMDPHDPYFELPYNGKAVARVDTPNPDPSRAAELRRLYIANVEYMDGFIAKLIAALEAAGQYEDTAIVVVADHGEEFYEHGGWWHGTTLYEEQIHVPFIVKLPGNRSSSTRVSSLASMVDVMPTMLAAMGLECSQACQGRNMLDAGATAKAVYAEEDHEGNVLESIRSEDWKLIVANEGNPRGLETVELYDLRADPGEKRNLAGEAPTELAELERDLALLKQAAGASAVAGVEGEIDEAAKERLRALGYIQ